MKNLERIVASFTLIFLLSSLGVLFLIIAPVYADVAPASQSHWPNNAGSGESDVLSQDVISPTFPVNPLITPTNGVTVTNPRPTFDWLDASDPGGAVVSYTLLITGSGAFSSASLTTTVSVYTPTFALPNDVYTWTVQAHDAAGNVSGYVTPPATFTLASRLVYLPIVFNSPSCPTTSTASFNLIPVDGPPADHPDYLHGDLNLALREYFEINDTLGLVDYPGSSDPNAPQLAGLFQPHRVPVISSVYRVNQWIWGCGTHGCRGPAITDPNVTLAGFVTTPGEAIYIPERGPEIYGGGYKVMVLYAEETRLTLGYTRQDTVANGYAVHLERVCVDPNLLALYQAQRDADGWHVTGLLPGLGNNQALGTAFGAEVKVAIRDRGTFMDPRSRKDWWQGY
jgi:hypothetical protein